MIKLYELAVFLTLVIFLSLTANMSGVADFNENLVGYWALDGNADDSVGEADGELIALLCHNND
jgi:hypothetical protein